MIRKSWWGHELSRSWDFWQIRDGKIAKGDQRQLLPKHWSTITAKNPQTSSKLHNLIVNDQQVPPKAVDLQVQKRMRALSQAFTNPIPATEQQQKTAKNNEQKTEEQKYNKHMKPKHQRRENAKSRERWACSKAWWKVKENQECIRRYVRLADFISKSYLRSPEICQFILL